MIQKTFLDDFFDPKYFLKLFISNAFSSTNFPKIPKFSWNCRYAAVFTHIFVGNRLGSVSARPLWDVSNPHPLTKNLYITPLPRDGSRPVFSYSRFRFKFASVPYPLVKICICKPSPRPSQKFFGHLRHRKKLLNPIFWFFEFLCINVPIGGLLSKKRLETRKSVSICSEIGDFFNVFWRAGEGVIIRVIGGGGGPL